MVVTSRTPSPCPPARPPRHSKVHRDEDVVVPRARVLVRPYVQRGRVYRHSFYLAGGTPDALVPVSLVVGDATRRQRHPG